MLLKSRLSSLTVAALVIVGSSSPIAKRSTGGYNDFSCKATSEHPNPLIMLHGMLGNSGEWAYMGPRFALKGYCAFSLDYGHLPNIPILGGLDDLKVSAQELSDFVDKVMAATGASKVDILGHSEGSTLPRVYFKYLNGTQKTGSFAAIGSNQYGTTLANIVSSLQQVNLFGPVQGALDPICKACFQLIINAPFLNDLNAGGDTYPEIKYLMLVSEYDEFVTPYTNGYLRTLGPNVHNVRLQDLCSLDLSDHLAQAIDPIAFNAIDSFLSTGEVKNSGCLPAIM
ncbi:triacylglycerol lipase [Entomortierella parvispora]|uniref:Triacylglycerol lipase n=1 Tax=Entomortierella parvispora TaxID=205924 RepID=A0A9P3M1A5_9FUNG|nr:triacylglycerol lipase [Entomortierella parvispora]